MTLKDQILDALKDGPGLACELAVEFGMDQRRMNANLCDMERRGLLKREPFSRAGIARHQLLLYSVKDAA